MPPRKPEMHQAVIATVPGSPRTAFDARITLEPCIYANRVRRKKPVM
ncbi:MAG: hypothetical protein HY763_05690 [Planctomycetes bacterium]|nr:hypothetical protein [Planctomycetota bacterium]